ncbi:tRNA uridine-5-carboxymethylaminomethyl(34) synthesis GTPase MnmE [Coprococcus sp. OM04-5BH]|uniref:tRNA uridine-5-carboxymethylaminomethyl(34) synthesis GTPase MnmE n=1 Tax=Coprococcus sp. OM04-5BH TaxID=2293093 RepID=UPI000E4D360D|nr:tRNA uridine-5-carboxymethylaminomethyl(34) synthesis GTPase MnmE [Coprococcus sp. OM04-5BH]RHV34097.1 tRNA uridine-5-carboxymethylaminomethyl(34) synthesis GTPase MnmE [Coprococcus sp. OM04-5BH]
MFLTDTICAIATGMGNAGIGIIRISGSEAINIASKVFKPANDKKVVKTMKSYTAAFGGVYDGDNMIDEGILLLMKGPHTYTCEDVCELQCHGGVHVLKEVLEAVIKAGARIAEPGEFTKRAFLNGRIDMSQAESVMDIINAKNDFAVKSSLVQLKGELKDRITEMRDTILYNTAFIESALDDPEHYSLEGYPQKLRVIVDNMVDNVDKLLATYDNGRVLKEGIKTVIAGKPNAGKSSLLNLLLGEDRAIVTEIEGTTRDTLEEVVNINGIILNIVDTAGIRSTDDVVEKIGVDKALKNVDNADLILYVVDGSKQLDDNDSQIISHIKGRNVITVINKSDLDVVVDKLLISEELPGDIIEISAKYGDGKEELYNILNDKFFSGQLQYNDELYITNSRHKDELIKTRESLSKVIESIDMGMEEDFFSIDLLDAYEHLGMILGETMRDDLADKIFEEFCMGK